jgi:uncharacterized repeat protein (TIGR01451 family)
MRKALRGLSCRTFRDAYLLPALLILYLLSSGVVQAQIGVYADPVNGQDTASCGSSASPCKSVAKTQTIVQGQNHNQNITVYLRNGTYYLPMSPTNPGETLFFGTADSGTSTAHPITWKADAGATPIISGGVPVGAGGLGLQWTQDANNPQLYSVTLPTTINGQPIQDFEYLFYNGGRRLRSRLQSSSSLGTGLGYYWSGGACYSIQNGASQLVSDNTLCNLGTYMRVANTVTPGTPDAESCPSVTNSKNTSQSKCLDRFYYNPGDQPPLAAWENLNSYNTAWHTCTTVPSNSSYPQGDITLTLFDSWTVDMMRIACIDTNKNIVYFTGQAKSNATQYNDFGPAQNHRFVVENTRDAFDAANLGGQTGIWFLDRPQSGAWTLYYLANGGETPNSDSVVIAQVQPQKGTGTTSLPQGGSLISATGLSNVVFSGIVFEVDNDVPPFTGFNNDENSDDTLPVAIDCENCTNVIFDGVTVRHTSASGILFAATSGTSALANDIIQNSALYDIGDSGIRTGHLANGSDQPNNVIHGVTVQNNLIQGYSRVFPDGEGISLSGGHNVLYSHNDITDGYHAGISVCQIGCPSHTANGNYVTTQYNHIWNIMQGVTSDGGTLYYHTGGGDGTGLGNYILNNLVHDTTDSVIIDAGIYGSGYGGEGIYLDNLTGGVDVENNVVYRVSASTAWMTEGPAPGVASNTFANNIFAYGRMSMFSEQSSWPSGCTTNPGPSLRVSLTNNIFYFDLDDAAKFYLVQGCAYTCGLSYNGYQNFQGNLYWRTDGAFSTYGKQFHVSTNSYSTDGSSCTTSNNPTHDWTFFPFSTWQSNQQPASWGPPGGMNEDLQGSVVFNPGFGSTNNPADFWLNADPVSGLLDHTKTNDTIANAGRQPNPPIPYPAVPTVVPPTFPTYSYTPVPITVQTNPAGLQVTVDGGISQTAPAIANLPQGGKHTLSVASPQYSGSTKYTFSKWSDSNTTAGDVITVGTTAATYTATFTATQLPDLTIVKTHSGNFSQGDTGDTYTITVTNSGAASTSGMVSVADTLPNGLTATAISGKGWSCNPGTLTCTRSDVLAGGSSYPAMALTVNVASNAPANVTNTATVSGGGEINTANDTANDLTAIVQAPTVTTAAATSITSGSATLSGSVNPNGADTQAWFLYSTNSSMSGAVPTPQQDVGSGTVAAPFAAGIAGLAANTPYYFQAVAGNSAGTVQGSILKFTTTSALRPAKIGTYNTGQWYLDVNGNGTYDGDPPDLSAAFGWAGATCIAGDWNGDGRQKIGIYIDGFWYLDYDGNGVWDGGVNDKAYVFGWADPNVIPVTGDWNGDGRTKIGIYYQGIWYLDYDGNGVWDGGVNDKTYNFGWPAAGVTPMVGDWSSTGTAKIGVYYNGLWYLDYDGNGVWDGGVNDKAYNFGWQATGVTPILGDWNGDGRAKIGVYYNGYWYLDYDGNGIWDGGINDKQYNLGWADPAVTPVMGDWTGTGTAKIGVFYEGRWYLDFIGNGIWDGGIVDKTYIWGQTADTPVVGRW